MSVLESRSHDRRFLAQRIPSNNASGRSVVPSHDVVEQLQRRREIIGVPRAVVDGSIKDVR